MPSGRDGGSRTSRPVLEHVRVIGGEMQRLDQVMQGFLKFTRPEDLKLQAISRRRRSWTSVVRVIGPECERRRRARS